MAGQVEDFTPGGVFQGENINFSIDQPSSSSGLDKYVSNITVEDTHTIKLTYTDDTTRSIDLTGLELGEGGGGGTDTNDYITGGSVTGNTLTLNRSDGVNISIDVSSLAGGGGTDTNDYVDSASLDADTDRLRLGYNNSGITDLVVPLDRFANIDNQGTGVIQFTQGNHRFNFVGELLTITDVSAPEPVFSPSESNPDPVNALDETEVVFDAPEANADFAIDNVAVSSIEIKDTDGLNVSSDTNLATVNSDNTVTVDFSTIDNDHAIGEIDLEIEVTDNEGDTVTLNPVADLFVPYYTLSSNTDYTSLTDFQDDAVASTEAIGSSVTIDGVGQGRKKYWIMTNGTYTFMQQGFMLEATIVTTGKIGQYTYNLYDLGEFGNPFDSTEDSPDITLDVS